MKINYKIISAFVLGVITKTFVTPWILGYSDENYSIHRNKIYEAIFFCSITGLILIIIDIGNLTFEEKIFWIVLYLSIFFTTKFFINNQINVNEKELLLKLRENYAESNKLAEILLNDDKLSPNVKSFIVDHKTLKKEAINNINELLKNL
jgi:hypothetical protein